MYCVSSFLLAFALPKKCLCTTQTIFETWINNQYTKEWLERFFSGHWGHMLLFLWLFCHCCCLICKSSVGLFLFPLTVSLVMNSFLTACKDRSLLWEHGKSVNYVSLMPSPWQLAVLLFHTLHTTIWYTSRFMCCRRFAFLWFVLPNCLKSVSFRLVSLSTHHIQILVQEVIYEKKLFHVWFWTRVSCLRARWLLPSQL